MNRAASILSSIALMASYLSCSKRFEPVDENLFYDIVYVNTHSRKSGGNWLQTQGFFRLKFTQNSDGMAGKFVFSYLSFFEPQFCSFNTLCVCSGGASGSFVTKEPEVTIEESETYDVSAPYVSGNQSQGNAINQEASEVKNFIFNISLEKRSLSPGCKDEPDRVVVLSRFKNGVVIMKSEGKELYLVPEIVR